MIVKGEGITNSDPKYFSFVHTLDAEYFIGISELSFSFVGDEQSFPANLRCLISNY